MRSAAQRLARASSSAAIKRAGSGVRNVQRNAFQRDVAVAHARAFKSSNLARSLQHLSACMSTSASDNKSESWQAR